VDVKIKGIYRHFKGGYYLVEDIARHSETLEPMVVYRALYGDGGLFVRPYGMFIERLDKVRYSDAGQENRFELCEFEDIRGK